VDPPVTILLNDSDPDRAAKLLPLLYDQLRATAQVHLASERKGHTLSATALVHEAYLKLCGPRHIPWQNRAHFYTAAAQAMRQVLLDHAKARARHKRVGARVDLEAAATLGGPDDADPREFIALDEALRRLEGKDPRAAQIVHLRYFAALSIAETALALGISERTVKNDWTFARAWLERELREVPDE
jgi:RNA polymerase sigma-70 factor, ECF subfamily